MSIKKKNKPRLSDYIKFHPKQKMAYNYIGKGYRIFYGGARGGGKSHLALMSAVLVSLQFPGLRTVLIRKTYGELEDNFISVLKELYPQETFGYVYRDKNKTAIFNNGSRVMFRALDSEKNAQKILGIEFQFMIVDEANNYDISIIHRLSGSLRNARVSGFVPTLLMTGNPGGMADQYFKTRFVNPDKRFWDEYEVQSENSFMFIPASVHDNPTVDQSYVDWLKSLPEHLRKAWLEGSWEIFEGQFFEEWSNKTHVIEPFNIPSDWDRIAGLDLGFTKNHPTVCLWLAQDPTTKDLYIYREYAAYGVTEQYILDIKAMQHGEHVRAIYADPSMFNSSIKQRFDDESPDFMFMREGLPLTPANNDRINGWRVMKQWLHWTQNKPPRMYVFDICHTLIQTLPSLRYAKTGNIGGVYKEDLDTNMQDDAVDALRYALVSGYGYPTPSEAELLGQDTQVEPIKRVDTPIPEYREDE